MSHLLTTESTPSPALNTRWLRDNLPRHLWQGHESPGEILDLDIIQAWDSRKRRTVLYELSLRGADQHVQWQTYVGYQPKVRSLLQDYQSILDQAATHPPVGRAVTLVPEANLIMVAFPNDRKMRLLSESDLREWVARHLSKIVPGPPDAPPWQVHDTKLEVLRYVPNKRITIRCWVTIRNGRGEEKSLSFILKQFSDAIKAQRVHRSLKRLHAAMAGESEARPTSRAGHVAFNNPVRLPREIALDKSKAFVLMEDLPGKELKEVLCDIDLRRVIPTVGELLARFHLIKTSVSKCVSMESEVAEIQETLEITQVSLPSLQPSLEALFTKLKSLKWLDDVPAVLLHGSYRLNHILIHRDELALLDLDSLRMGHPAYDIANFLSSLYYFEIQGQLQTSVRKKVARLFIEGYSRTAPWDVSPKAVLWYLASLLINKQAHKYVTHFHGDQGKKVGSVLTRVDAVLQKAESLEKGLTFENLWRVLP